MADVIALDDLEAAYPGGRRFRYEGSLVVRAGERIALLGANGAGKTTLLRLVAGLMAPTGGRLEVFGEPPAARLGRAGARLAMLMQDVGDQLIAPTVAEDVAFTPRNLGWPEAGVAEAVAGVLATLGIEALAHRLVHELSGGERVKVALAGALIGEPALVLADEPFEHLDPVARREVVELLAGLGARGVALVLSTHQVNLVGAIADRVVVLAPGGRLAMVGTPAEVFARPAALQALHVEPPLLAGLFQGLDISGPAPAGLDEAVARLKSWREDNQGRAASKWR